MVLIDTSVWSLALRRRASSLNRAEQAIVAQWSSLVRSGRATLMGPIRQEILSGIRRAEDFDRLRTSLSAFRHVSVLPQDYDDAAALFNRCRARGITGTSIDLLVCAVASRANIQIFTVDADFERFDRVLAIRLHRM